MTTHEETLRKELAASLDWRRAHVNRDDLIKQIPSRSRGVKPDGAPHTFWHLLEHLRICQKDILDYCRDPGHESPPFPEGYWPSSATPQTAEEWEESLERFRNDLESFRALLLDPQTDLFSPPPGGGPSVLHEALILVDHNAYHLGQLVLMLRLLKNWKEKPIDY